jgi:cystathionine beta-lyase/cystathionine gamma-synthase
VTDAIRIADIDPADVAICLGDPVPEQWEGATSPPIVQTSLFSFPSFRALLDGLSMEHTAYVYTRGQNPTVEAVERKIAALERGEACKCFGSGMAAVSAVMLGLLEQGDHILFVNQTYGPTLQLAEHLERFGIEHDLLLDLSVEDVERAVRPTTKLIWLESPGTMLFRVLDLEAIAAFARSRNILTCIDNSWATPLFQKPLTVGVDLVMHTATKYLGGHSDLVAGAVVGPLALMEPIFHRSFLLNGGILAPHDAWLLNRGLLTLPTRLRQHAADGLRVAEFLRDHPAVRRVFHPALTDDRALAARQLAGVTGVFGFELVDGTFAAVERVIDALERFRIAVSWGGVESIVISPNNGANAERLARQRLPEGLVRLSVGLEGADALIADLTQALDAASA